MEATKHIHENIHRLIALPFLKTKMIYRPNIRNDFNLVSWLDLRLIFTIKCIYLDQ